MRTHTIALALIAASIAHADHRRPPVDPSEAFLRAISVLHHLGVPDEADSQPTLDDLHRRQTLSGLEGLLPMLDPTRTFDRFAVRTERTLETYQDIDGRAVRDYSVSLVPADQAPSEPPAFDQRLKRAKGNPAARPLAGLRIAIDPGHMGGEFWDIETGKRVHDRQGRWLSEGVLNLQVSLLLEEQLRALGAEVMLTRRVLSAVSSVDYAQMDLRPYAHDALRDQVLEPWFQDLLASGPSDSSPLFAAVDASTQIQAILANTPANRNAYYIRGEDLIARADAISRFDADLSLVVHFDAVGAPASDPLALNPKRYSATKAYVMGSFEPGELSSRRNRALFAQHLLDGTSSAASLKLGRAVVGRLRKDAKLAYDRNGGGTSAQVEPGVFARNLGLSRRVTGRPLTYIECLHYNDATEFAALLKGTHPMMIDGKSYPYSDRLAQVTGAIREGVVDFVKAY